MAIKVDAAYAQMRAQLDAAAVEITGMTLPGPILFVSVYRDQSRDTMDLVDYLRDLLFQFPNGNVVVGGDFNMKSKALGAPVDGRGGEELRLLVEELQEEGGGCSNTGKPTWLGRPTDPRVWTQPTLMVPCSHRRTSRLLR